MAYGFKPVSGAGGSYHSGGFDRFEIDVSAQNTINKNIWNGDPVRIETDSGKVVRNTTAVASATPMLGIFVGCEYKDANGDKKWSNYYPTNSANTEAYAFVATNPNQLFQVSGTQASAVFPTVTIGQIQPVVFADGTNSTGISGVTISLTGTEANDAAFRILGAVQNGSNEVGSNTAFDVYGVFNPLAMYYGSNDLGLV
jgi:hypothetical protein